MNTSDNDKKRTKKEQIANIFANHYGTLDRSKIVEKVVDKLGISEGSARTQVSILIKQYAVANKLSYPERNIDRGKLKKYKAIKLFDSNPQLSRNLMIEKFKEELDMSYNSAATHCSMCSKRYIEQSTTASPIHNAVVYPEKT